MFTIESRVNGGLVAVLHVHNGGLKGYEEHTESKDIPLYEYEYEYYEPEVGIQKEYGGKHIRGSVVCRRDMGLNYVTMKICEDIENVKKGK